MNGVLGHFVKCAFEGMMQTEHKLYIPQTERKPVVSVIRELCDDEHV